MEYPITLERDDNDTYLVSFPDFPEAQTFGDTVEEAIERAADALATVVDAYIKDRRPIPMPSVQVSRYRVTMPALTETKVLLYETMRARRISKADLAKRLNVHAPQVDRLLDVHHGSQFGQLEAAFRVMGKRIAVSVEDEPTATRRRAVTSRRRVHALHR